jgi:hypothetical protein
MPPAAATREEERRLNTRTLTIASVASATAAAVTSQLWIAGTWIAAALTPVLVALISEALHRPTERVARAWTAEREPRGGRSGRAQTATRAEPAAVTGEAGPVRMYRQTSRGVTQSGRGVGAGRAVGEAESGGAVFSGRRIPWRAVLLTGAAAFVIAIAAITIIDLASTGSVNTTPLGRSGGARSHTSDSTEQKQDEQKQTPQDQQSTTPEETPTTTAPQQQAPPSETAPATPPTPTTPVDPNATP